MNNRLIFTIVTVLLALGLSSYFAPPKKRNGKLVPGADTSRLGWVDTVIRTNGNKFHLTTRLQRDSSYEGFPYSYNYLVETYDDRKSYKQLSSFVNQYSHKNNRPDCIVLYTADSNVYTIVAGKYESVRGISVFYHNGSAYDHYGFIKGEHGFTSCGIVKSKYNDKHVYCDDVSVFFKDSVKSRHSDVNALYWFNESPYWDE